MAINALKARVSAKEKATQAKRILNKCSVEELNLFHEVVYGYIGRRYKRVYVVAIWSHNKKSVEVIDSIEKCETIVRNMGPGKNDYCLFPKYSSSIPPSDFGVTYTKRDWKGIILDTNFLLPLSWPFEVLPLAVGRYSEIHNEIINWRLKIGR